MVKLFVRRNRLMMLVSATFFCMGCIFALSVTQLDCAGTILRKEQNDFSESLSKYAYAVLVISGPDNEAKRDAIRTTWGKLTNNIFTENGELLYKWNHTWVGQQTYEEIIKFYFVLGTQGLSETALLKLKAENSRSKDLMLLDTFVDSYNNLTTKMLQSFRWLSMNMKGLKYLIKCDDDSFVRVDLIVKNLDAYAPNMNDPALSEYISHKKNLPSYKGLYWGYFDGRARARLSGKWKETDWFLCDNYLPYALGGGYVISRSIIDYVAKNADLLSVYNSEDVSMGVWTAPLDAINRVHDIRFDAEWKSRGCSEHMLVRHKQSPSDMFYLYKTLVHSRGKKLCKTEAFYREPYMYKWNVLPSSCCKV